jgi:hypothetical protein
VSRVCHVPLVAPHALFTNCFRRAFQVSRHMAQHRTCFIRLRGVPLDQRLVDALQDFPRCRRHPRGDDQRATLLRKHYSFCAVLRSAGWHQSGLDSPRSESAAEGYAPLSDSILRNIYNKFGHTIFARAPSRTCCVGLRCACIRCAFVMFHRI